MKDGATLGDHLRRVEAITRSRQSELIEPELVPGCEIIWNMYLSLHAGRDGDKPLSWRDLHAWQEVQQLGLDTFEIDILMTMDRAAMIARNSTTEQIYDNDGR